MTAPMPPGNDPSCRYAANDYQNIHTCRRRDGAVLGDGEICFAEASQQIADAITAEREATPTTTKETAK